MREVVMSSEEVVEVKVIDKVAEDGVVELPRRRLRRKDDVEGGDGLVKWEKFLPKIALRVLLVEADDSTRQIIAALLRKCSYRVAAVSDGLKAWEMLKGRPEGVDLILAEVDLPSISGYALLTLIMEHEICKNIPVIMMSTHDSVNTVYKCMLKGAADYLVKPLRRNELRNLWQHVWRRQSSLAPGGFPLSEGVDQRKLEGSSANNSTSNHENPVIGNGGDAQSSCTRPEMEGESADVEDTVRDSSQMQTAKSLSDETRALRNEMQSKLDSATKEAIDFMGASFRRNRQLNKEESTAKYESQLELDLSLKRSNASENTAERPCLKPSSASAFTRYVHRPLQTQCSVSPVVNDQRKNDVALSETLLINQHNSSEPLPSAPSRNEAGFYTTADASGPITTQMYSCPGQTSYPTTPFPVKSTQFTGPNTGYASPSPTSVSPHEYSSRFHPFQQSSVENSKPESLKEREGYLNSSDSPNILTYQTESLEERRNLYSATEQTAIGSQCNGVQYYEKMNEDGYSSSVGRLHQALQREAALNKFRMKRKDRCFDKKVRYESRKKLAEQRPRVKGQFVRQVQTNESSIQVPNTTTQDYTMQ